MTRNGRAYRQRLWVPAISGTAGGALRTPTCGMVNQDRSQDPQYMRKLQAKGQTVTLAAQMKSAEMLPTPVAQTGAGGPKGLDGGSGARQMLTAAGFPRAAGAPSSLPTPRTCSAMAAPVNSRGNLEGDRFPNLETVVRDQMLPTPSACVANDGERPETWLARRERVKLFQ